MAGQPSGEPENSVLEIIEIGNSLGVILPKELLARLGLAAGDELHVVECAQRSVKLRAYDSKHAEALRIARQSFEEFAKTYEALAK